MSTKTQTDDIMLDCWSQMMEEGSVTNYRVFLVASIILYSLMMCFFYVALPSLTSAVVVLSAVGILTFLNLLWRTRPTVSVPLVSGRDENIQVENSRSPITVS